MKPTWKWVAGGIGLVISTGGAAGGLGARAFNRIVEGDVRALLDTASSTENGASAVTEEMLAPLPEPVQRYLRYTGVVGRRVPRTVRLRQEGKMRLARGQPWIPLRAEEHYSVRPPGFVWDGRMRLGPLSLARARDMYRDGRGHMLVKPASLFTVADATGEEMDQAALVRYLSEMIWFPTAFLGDNASFEALDATSARVTLIDHGRTATGTLHVDGEGRLTDFVAERQRLVGTSSQVERWSTPVTAYGELQGLRLPIRGAAVWKLAEGDLEYIQVNITELEYDVGITGLGARSSGERRGP